MLRSTLIWSKTTQPPVVVMVVTNMSSASALCVWKVWGGTSNCGWECELVGGADLSLSSPWSVLHWSEMISKSLWNHFFFLQYMDYRHPLVPEKVIVIFILAWRTINPYQIPLHWQSELDQQDFLTKSNVNILKSETIRVIVISLPWRTLFHPSPLSSHIHYISLGQITMTMIELLLYP